jgi:hypothetical protein
MGNYVARYERLRVTGDAILIDLYCAPACAIVLGIIPRDKICVTCRAELLFHAADNPVAWPQADQTRSYRPSVFALPRKFGVGSISVRD